MNYKDEVKDNPDEVGDNLVPETEFKENSGRRQRKLNKKCKEYKISLLKIRKQRLHNQLTRKCCAIDDLLYSKDHFVAVKEELRLLDSLYSQLLLLREEYNYLVDGEDFSLQEFDNWFEDFEARVFTFKDKVRNRVKEAKVDRKSGKSKRSKSSIHSKSSSGSFSGSLKSRLAEEKAKLAEIAAEAKYVEKKHELQRCTKKLEIEEKLAKAEAKLKALEGMENYQVEGKNQENNFPESNCNMLNSPLNFFRNPAEQMFSSKIEDKGRNQKN